MRDRATQTIIDWYGDGMAYDNTNTGMMYRNEEKEEDKHPDFRGFINIDGEEYWLSAWIKEGKEGGKMEGKRFFSMSFKPKEQRQQKPAPKPAPRKNAVDEMDDDIPF